MIVWDLYKTSLQKIRREYSIYPDFMYKKGFGVLPNGNLLLAMSKDLISLFDFADFFKSNGCKNALYLDGFVSRTFLPKKKYEQFDGDFGVIIAETECMN